MIISSFQAQYGIRLSRDIHGMKWGEFAALVSGLGPDTVLGRIIAIRAEDNKSVLKQFSKEQLKIRNDYRTKKATKVSKSDMNEVLNNIKQMFIVLA